jgi:hypothetical protein
MATIKRAELELDWDVDAQELWDRQVPERLVDAIVATEERYDAVVVDEGQDFAASWWSPIQWLLEDEEDGIVYIFMDNNQRLYDRSRELPIDSEPFSLTLNCRNTRHIHDFVKSFFSGESVPQVDGPVGRPVEIIRCRDSSDLGPAVLAKFQRLFGREKVDLGDVIVLTGHGARRSQLNGLQGEGFRIEVGPRKKKCVELESIYGFKGLERPIVALADLEDLDEDRIDRLMYVGASRAQSHLLVFAPEGLVLPAM